ncbi:Cyclic AMP-responsive element-binding protein 3-like protein 4 [Frankliniella fusca]|uniref:Cyclic AMP-responsive element-binding protein 3-like protein 4 n=1 Tax=Frankliniella fusca TaxID=407009 RepID=A0AAE1GXY6_9NEOP|nr:Cyclic AMP-responsive element-binding protein 3-like protein 4 [Frankliniella fusca]
MSITSDMNLMDLLFDKEDPTLHLTFDKDDLYPKDELVDIESKPSFGISSEVWPSNPDEFLDSLLNGSPFDDSILAETEIGNPITSDVCLSGDGSLSPVAAVVSSSSSDSGVNSDVHSDIYSDVYDQAAHDVAEDSGASVDLQMSPLKQELEEDIDLSSAQSIPASPEIPSSPEGGKFDLLDSAVLSAGILDSNNMGQLQLKNNTAIINMNLATSDSDIPITSQPSNISTQQLTLRPVKSWKRNGSGGNATNVRQMIRVTPMPAVGSSNSGHPRSILLPLQDLKDVRTIKIVNANNVSNKRARCRPMVPAVGKGTPVTLLQVKPGSVLNTINTSPPQSCSISSSMSDIMQMSGDDSSDDSSDNAMDNSQNPYPRLVLSPEEKRLMEKEGVTLPTHYPLTKQEERELKRIRRKIRNKISAQDSRKRKKEYVDGLEDRVKQCTDENRELLKRLKVLQSQNESLATQLQRLRTVVARGMSSGSSRAAQPATCLMVLLLSLALVMVPNLRPGNNTLEDQELSSATSALNADNKLPALPGRSRTLLHSKVGAPLFAADSTDDMELLDEEELKITLPTLGKRQSHFQESSSFLDHDFGPSEKKKARFSIDPGEAVRQFIDPDIDEVWPPPTKQKDNYLPIDDRIESIVEQLLNNKTEEPSSTLVLPVSQEGR